MRILVNATNLRVGGGVQKAVEFVRASLLRGGGHEFRYALSDVVASNLRTVVETDGLDLLVTDKSPAKPLAGRRTVAALLDLEKRFRPDVVFTVFGPTYVRFESPHLMGFAVPWISHPNAHAWRTVRNPLTKAWYWAWIKRTTAWTHFADQWVLETAVAADGLSRELGVDRGRFHVIPNIAADQYYRAAEEGGDGDPRMTKEIASDFHLLAFSAWYPHKNLELVPAVAAEAKKRDPQRRHRFFLTFDRSLPAWANIHRDAVRRGVEDRVINLGPILVGDGPRAYRSSDALFLPTLLESFTATYPEAMCMSRPILTTDLGFAREICGDAAMYFAPNDASSAAEAVARLAGSDPLREDLVRRGRERLARGATPGQIHDDLLRLLEITATQGTRQAARNGAARVPSVR